VHGETLHRFSFALRILLSPSSTLPPEIDLLSELLKKGATKVDGNAIR